MKTILCVLFVSLFNFCNYFSFVFSQEVIDLKISNNHPSVFESEEKRQENKIHQFNPELELTHKQFLESGNYDKALLLEEEMSNLMIHENMYYILSENHEARKAVEEIPLSQGDWLTSNSVIFPGQPKTSTILHKQLDVKLGEDNNLYAVFSCPGSGIVHGQFYIYKSTNFGLDWTYVYGVGTGPYIGNISMLVESRNNSIPDSTRIIVFYTLSNTNDLNSSAYLSFFSLKTDASAIISGTIANPESGKTFTHISTVSDGAFWQSATYFGVVVSESNIGTGETYRTRFFRTINWGATWTGISINTGYNDLYPSAEYKEGSADSVYIAFQRKFSETNHQIRVIAIPWLPTSAFYTYYLTNDFSAVYEKPCITIKQKNPADSLMISCTKNGMPAYHYSANAGNQWVIDNLLSPANGSNKTYTICSSSRTGDKPFSVCWVSNDGDSINVRRGVLGNFGQTIYKINSNSSLNSTTPVCVTIPTGSLNNTLVAYASSPSGIYATQEGLKQLNVKMYQQGFYNPVLNKLNMKDTIKMYLRNSIFPYAIADSAASVLDSNGAGADFQFTGLNDGLYYLVVKHRNSLETWGSYILNLAITGTNDYNFTYSADLAYGNNQIQVDNSPLRFAVFGGDVNQDGVIDAADLSRIENDANNYLSGYIVSDLTGNNFVDGSDYMIADNNAAGFVTIQRP